MRKRKNKSKKLLALVRAGERRDDVSQRAPQNALPDFGVDSAAVASAKCADGGLKPTKTRNLGVVPRRADERAVESAKMPWRRAVALVVAAAESTT